MNTYVVQYWVPFPDSEYGGVIVVNAKDRLHLKQILEERHGRRAYGFRREFLFACQHALQVNGMDAGIMGEMLT